MAKQTFTTGQVLTAAQMTSLQQTAMLGGEASAKIASYTLVAADAGTAISMSNAGATTITVNTGLFAAGDIVTILNIGAGVCTITAGTATVATSGSLALAQNQGGVLRFTSASAAIFFQFATPASGDIEGVTAGTGISGGGTSGTVTITNSMATAIDAKGDLVVGTGADAFARLAVGADGTTLVADSSVSPTGLKWAVDPVADVITTAGDLIYGTAADTVARLGIGTAGQVLKVNSGATAPEWGAAGGASGLTLVSSTSLSASTININSVFSSTYENYVLILNVTNMSLGANIRFRLRASGTDTTTNYGMQLVQTYQSTLNGQESSVTTYWQFGNADPTECWMVVELARPNVAATTFAISHSITGLSGTYDDLLSEWYGAVQKSSTQFDGITIFSHNSATITGTMRIYGRANS